MIKYILITILLFLAVGCTQNETNPKTGTEPVDTAATPDTELQEATIYLYKKERITTEINALRIMKFDNIDSMMAYTLDIDLIDSTGKVTTQIVGDSGVIREAAGVLRIFGNVLVETENGLKLETDYLWWDSNTDRIKSDDFVKITRVETGDVMSGWGLDSDKDLSTIKILDRVSGSINDLDNVGN